MRLRYETLTLCIKGITQSEQNCENLSLDNSERNFLDVVIRKGEIQDEK